MSDEVKMPEPGIDTANHAHIRVIGYTADQMREYADAKCEKATAHIQGISDAWKMAAHQAVVERDELRRRVAELEADARRLDYLDSCNLPKRMGWDISKAPSGNVKVSSVIFLGSDPVTIRAAIDDAIGAEGGE